MRPITTLICSLVMLAQYSVLGDAPYDIQFVKAKLLCSSTEYVNNADVSVITNGPKATFNSKFTIVKETPQDAICSTDFFRKKDEEFKKSPYIVTPGPCCEVLFDPEYFYYYIVNNQNIPKECPFKEGTYSVHKSDFKIDENFRNVQRGEYKAEFKSTLPSGECLYGVEVIFKIVDKA